MENEKETKKVKKQKVDKKAKLEEKYDQSQILAAQSLSIVLAEGKVSTAKLEHTQKVGKILWLILVYAFLILMAVVVLIPFYWMIITSLKNADEIRNEMTYFPRTVAWSNYVILFKGADAGVLGRLSVEPFKFGVYLRNTLIVGIFSTLGTLVTTIFAAFAFARLNFKGKNILFAIFLATMMIPGEMMVITNYITVSKLGWLGDTNLMGAYLAMIVPFWVSVFYIYLLRQNFKQIPNELYYAAKVDGKSDWQYLWKVMVPLASPTLITIFILKLMGAWNSYVWPNLVANQENMRLITNGLRAYNPSPDGGTDSHQGLQMAATVLVTTPLLLLFIFFRKYIMRGVGRAGIKG